MTTGSEFLTGALDALTQGGFTRRRQLESAAQQLDNVRRLADLTAKEAPQAGADQAPVLDQLRQLGDYLTETSARLQSAQDANLAFAEVRSRIAAIATSDAWRSIAASVEPARQLLDTAMRLKL